MFLDKPYFILYTYEKYAFLLFTYSYLFCEEKTSSKLALFGRNLHLFYIYAMGHHRVENYMKELKYDATKFTLKKWLIRENRPFCLEESYTVNIPGVSK